MAIVQYWSNVGLCFQQRGSLHLFNALVLGNLSPKIIGLYFQKLNSLSYTFCRRLCGLTETSLT